MLILLLNITQDKALVNQNCNSFLIPGKINSSLLSLFILKQMRTEEYRQKNYFSVEFYFHAQSVFFLQKSKK